MKILLSAILVAGFSFNGFAMGAKTPKNAKVWQREHAAEVKKATALAKQIDALNVRISGNNLQPVADKRDEATTQNAKNLLGALGKSREKKAIEYAKESKNYADAQANIHKAVLEVGDSDLIKQRDALQKDLDRSKREAKALGKAIQSYQRDQANARERAKEYRECFIRDHDRNGDGKVESGKDFPDRVGGRDFSRVS